MKSFEVKGMLPLRAPNGALPELRARLPEAPSPSVGNSFDTSSRAMARACSNRAIAACKSGLAVSSPPPLGTPRSEDPWAS